MAWFEETPIPLFKKEYSHNLGFRPIVVGYVNLESLGKGVGWKQIPFMYAGDQEWSDEYGSWVWPTGTVDFYHKDDNTVVFIAPLNTEIVANIFIDPQEEAWYE